MHYSNRRYRHNTIKVDLYLYFNSVWDKYLPRANIAELKIYINSYDISKY